MVEGRALFCPRTAAPLPFAPVWWPWPPNAGHGSPKHVVISSQTDSPACPSGWWAIGLPCWTRCIVKRVLALCGGRVGTFLLVWRRLSWAWVESLLSAPARPLAPGVGRTRAGWQEQAKCQLLEEGSRWSCQRNDRLQFYRFILRAILWTLDLPRAASACL